MQSPWRSPKQVARKIHAFPAIPQISTHQTLDFPRLPAISALLHLKGPLRRMMSVSRLASTGASRKRWGIWCSPVTIATFPDTKVVILTEDGLWIRWSHPEQDSNGRPRHRVVAPSPIQGDPASKISRPCETEGPVCNTGNSPEK